MILSMEMWEILAPAFVAGVIVASTHVPLGQEVLNRGIIFIDLAIAQIAALGAIFARFFFQDYASVIPWSFIFALMFALGAGFLFSWLERTMPKQLEALIGSCFVLSASMSILLLANDPHGGEYMHDMLAGQILWVNWQQLLITAITYVAILILWFRYKEKYKSLFYVLFPVAVTLSVKLVGVYLVFASLIIPAIGAVRYAGKKRLVMGYVIAICSFVCGIGFSVFLDLPSGPVIVCAFPIFAGLIYFVRWGFKTPQKDSSAFEMFE